MIEIVGSNSRFCDGVSRREFVRIGSIGLAALTLPELLQRRAQGDTSKKTSVIFLELAGGPTQFETYDPKPHAPSEYRGPFGTVNTNVTGVRFSELMVEQAQVMDKLAIIRSIHHERSSHDPSSHLTQTGYYKEGRKGGQVVGSSTSKGKKPADSPYRQENVLAMVYQHLGIDPQLAIPDLAGRPRYLLERRDVISELI